MKKGKGSGNPKDDREARLADALRANLRRRKAAARTMAESGSVQPDSEPAKPENPGKDGS